MNLSQEQTPLPQLDSVSPRGTTIVVKSCLPEICKFGEVVQRQKIKIIVVVVDLSTQRMKSSLTPFRLVLIV